MYETPSYTLNCADYISLRESEHLQFILKLKNGHFWPFLSPKLLEMVLFIFFSTESCDHMYETPYSAILSMQLKIWRFNAVVSVVISNWSVYFCVFSAIFQIYGGKHTEVLKIININLEFLETIYQNVHVSVKFWHLSLLQGCLIGREQNENFMSIPNDHPV